MINKIIVYNYRGAKNKNFISNVKAIIGTYCLEVLVLLETQINISQVKPIFQALSYFKWYLVDGDGFLRGIWMAWKDYKVNVKFLMSNFQYIHTYISLFLWWEMVFVNHICKSR